MEETSQEHKESSEVRSDEAKPESEEKRCGGESVSSLDNLTQINCQVGSEKDREEDAKPEPAEADAARPEVRITGETGGERTDVETKVEDETSEKSSECALPKECCLNPTKPKDLGTKTKRKSRSTRRRLNAMVNNTSLHFSDTDSEGELTVINQTRGLSPVKSLSLDVQQGPAISVTFDHSENEPGAAESMNYLSPDEKGISRSGSFVENLTDVDEIYGSEPETETKKESQNSLVVDNGCQGETDLEDFEGDEEIQTPIYVKPRSDLLQELCGETITTKEGDGPFSVEIRNKMSREVARDEGASGAPDIIVLPNTDEEDMDVSDEEDLPEACCSQKELLEDLDILAASQIVMKNINKMENMLTVKEPGDDAISDCHTDVEDVE